jgi:hypothetical protein
VVKVGWVWRVDFEGEGKESRHDGIARQRIASGASSIRHAACWSNE